MGLGVERYLTGQAEAETEQNRSACRILEGIVECAGQVGAPCPDYLGPGTLCVAGSIWHTFQH